MADKFSLKLLGAIGIALCIVSPSWAEIRTIAATGEYRMGDNDTRTDAKRLALQDAKRLALEMAGTYLESITEVKNFQLGRDELRAYTAGIVEVTEQQTRSMMEGETTVVRVVVTCRIDSDVMARQIDVLRKNETAKTELLVARQEADRLRQENEALHQSLAAAKSKAKIETLVQKRREVLTDQEINSLLAQAWVAMAGSAKSLKEGSSSTAGRARARSLLEQALALDASNPYVHGYMGVLLVEEGSLNKAITEFRTALRLKPDFAEAHLNLGLTLQSKDDYDGAIAEFRTALHLKTDYAEVHNMIGHALLQKGDLDGAIAECRTVLRLKPDDASAHMTIAMAFKEQGHRSEAAREIREFLRLTPDTPAEQQNIRIAKAMLRDLE